MKKIILIALLLQLLLCCNTPDTTSNKVLPTPPQSNTSSTSSALTTFFYDYDRENSFRGVPFGYAYLNIKDNLKLAKPKYRTDKVYEIKNSNYLFFGPLKFDEGYAGFTNNGSLYKIELYLDNKDSMIYKSYKNHLMNKFGTVQEGENICNWEGFNIEVTLQYRPDSNVANNLCLMIMNKALNDQSNNELFKKLEKQETNKY